MPLKYISNFRRSLEILLINCKVELKLNLLSKTQNYMLPQSLYLQKTIKDYHKFLAQELKDQLIRMDIKRKVRIKIQQMSIDVFLTQIHLEFTNSLFWFIQIKIAIQKGIKQEYFLSKGTFKNYNFMIKGKNFYDQATDSDIKLYKETRKLSTG